MSESGKPVLPARVCEIDRIIARIHVSVERGRILQLPTYRVLLGPASKAGVVVARAELVQTRAAIEVACGKAPGVRHRPGGTGQLAEEVEVR